MNAAKEYNVGDKVWYKITSLDAPSPAVIIRIAHGFMIDIKVLRTDGTTYTHRLKNAYNLTPREHSFPELDGTNIKFKNVEIKYSNPDAFDKIFGKGWDDMWSEYSKMFKSMYKVNL